MATKPPVPDSPDLSLWNPASHKEIYNLQPHPVTGRLIDSHPGHRTRPMRLLCLGQSRTGTMSIYTALHKLGFRVYHMNEAVKAPRTNFGCWIEAIDAKWNGKGKPFGREEFDKLLGEFDAGADIPFATFGEDLIEAYPEAKILLNTRDVEQWLPSMNKTLGVLSTWWTWEYVAPWDPAVVGPWWRFAKAIVPHAFGTMSDFSVNGPAHKQFEAHYAHIRQVAPKDRLLEYSVKEGWEPLCKFLDLPIPDEPFPRVNDSDEFVRIHAIIWSMAAGKMVLKISAAVVPVVAVGLGWWNGWNVPGWRG